MEERCQEGQQWVAQSCVQLFVCAVTILSCCSSPKRPNIRTLGQKQYGMIHTGGGSENITNMVIIIFYFVSTQANTLMVTNDVKENLKKPFLKAITYRTVARI